MPRFLHATAAAAALLALALAPGAQAATQDLSTLGEWSAFDVDPLTATDGGLGFIDLDGNALAFTFTVTQAVNLTVVDGGFAGDVFSLTLNGQDIGTTSPASGSYPSSVGLDFDAALASPAYSHRTLTLGPGSYTLGGSLFASALDDTGAPIDATVGGVMITAVPEPASLALLLAGLGALSVVARRRSR
jgi:hypothetical protein